MRRRGFLATLVAAPAVAVAVAPVVEQAPAPRPAVAFGECTTEAHEEAKKSDVWWAAQEQKGVQHFDGRPYLSLVNCRCCGSTLARRIGDEVKS